MSFRGLVNVVNVKQIAGELLSAGYGQRVNNTRFFGFLSGLFLILLLGSGALANVVMIVNGKTLVNDFSEALSMSDIVLTLSESGEESGRASYDLTITADSGSLNGESSLAVSSLKTVEPIAYQYASAFGMDTVHIYTNKEMLITSSDTEATGWTTKAVAAGTEIYQLCIFDMVLTPDGRPLRRAGETCEATVEVVSCDTEGATAQNATARGGSDKDSPVRRKDRDLPEATVEVVSCDTEGATAQNATARGGSDKDSPVRRKDRDLPEATVEIVSGETPEALFFAMDYAALESARISLAKTQLATEKVTAKNNSTVKVLTAESETTISRAADLNLTATLESVDYGSYPCPDLNNDDKADMADFAVLAKSWLSSGQSPADLDGDGLVGQTDLIIFSGNWLGSTAFKPFTHSFEQVQGIGIEFAQREGKQVYVREVLGYAALLCNRFQKDTPAWFADLRSLISDSDFNYQQLLISTEMTGKVTELENLMGIAGELKGLGWEIEPARDIDGEVIYDPNCGITQFPVELKQDICNTIQGNKQYQYISLKPGARVSKGLNSARATCYARFSLIPQNGLALTFYNDGIIAGGVIFGDGELDPNSTATNTNVMYYYEDGILEQLSYDYTVPAEACLARRDNTDDNPVDEYENSWLDLEFVFDWDAQSYCVYLDHAGFAQKQLLFTAGLTTSGATALSLTVKENEDMLSSDINRISFSDKESRGGGIGVDCVMAVSGASVVEVEGEVNFSGRIWLEDLGYCSVRARPKDIYNLTAEMLPPDTSVESITADTANPEIYRGFSVGKIDDIAWNTKGSRNGDYGLEMILTDDLGRIVAREEIPVSPSTRSFMVNNNPSGAGCYRYVEPADLVVEWPGSFPCEFQRIYSSALRNMPVPMGYGWTHNHNIRISEMCSDQYQQAGDYPAADNMQLGIGSIWLQQADRYRLFQPVGQIEGSSEIKYLSSDDQSDYIIRSHYDNDIHKLRYIHYALDGMEMLFEPNVVLDDPNAVIPEQGGQVGWSASVGVKQVKDRFGNALDYIWNDDGTCIKMITNNRTSSVIKFNLFTYNGKEYPFYTSVETGTFENYQFDRLFRLTFNMDMVKLLFGHFEEYYAIFAGPVYEYANVNPRDNKPDYTLSVIKSWWYQIDANMDYAIGVDYDKEGMQTALGRHINEEQRWIDDSNIGNYDEYKHTHSIYNGHYQTIRERYYIKGDDYKVIETSVNPQGAVTKQLTYYLPRNTEFDADDYNQVLYSAFDGVILDNVAMLFPDETRRLEAVFNPLSGVTDVFYVYGDSRFDTLPTEIRYCFDKGGEQSNYQAKQTNKQYDLTRVISKTYDERGNVTSERAYLPDGSFILTQWQYHPLYNFKISEISWQSSCNIATDNSVIYPANGRIEKQWLYGNADGSADPNEGRYLICERQLLDETTNEWSETFYTYNQMGNPVSKTDPEGNVTYISYNSTGWPEKIWRGLASVPTDEPAGIAQMRYAYDKFGRKVLVADNLGKVTRYQYELRNSVYDGQYNAESYVYFDDTACSRAVFNPDVYPDKPYGPAADSACSPLGYRAFSGVYEQRCPGKPQETITEKGKVRYSYNFPDTNIAYSELKFYPDTSSTMLNHYSHTAMDGLRYFEWYDVCHWLDPEKFVFSIPDFNGRVMERYTGTIHRDKVMGKITLHESYEYTASGQIESEKVYNVQQGSFNENTGKYNFNRQLARHTVYHYDDLDRLIRQENMSSENTVGQTIEYGYDAAGNRIYTIDPAGKVIITDYDNANRKIKEYYPVEAVWLFDLAIDIKATRDNAKPARSYKYNNSGKLLSVLSYDTDGITLLANSQYLYDTQQRIMQTAELLGDLNENGVYELASDYALTNIQYSDTGSVFNLNSNDPNEYHVCITDAEDKSTYIQLHPTGKPSRVLYGSGDHEAMDYDGYGRLISKAIWSGSQKQKISYEYDTDSNLSRQIYPDGGYIEYDYRELSTNWNGGLYYYNTGDLLCQIYDRRNWGDNPYGVAGVDYTDPNTPAPTYSFAYYADSGNLKSYTMPDGIRIEYGYDQALNAKTSVEVFREEERIYYQNYEYNQLGQLSALTYLEDPNSFDLPEPLAELFYDDNGNREFMYYDQIPIGSVGEKFRIQYGYNSNNYLTSINSLVYTLDGVAVDGLGRLKSCFESLNGIHHDNNYSYDMRSQLTYSKRKDITSTNPVCQPWTEEKLYHDKAGNIIRAEKVNSSDASNILGTNYGFNGDILTGATGADIWSLDNDANGNITSLAGSPNSTVTYNYDNKLKYASKGSDTISVKYDPMGNRIVKHSVLNGISRNQRFIVDINSDLPVVLCVLDCSDTGGAGSGQDLPSSLEKLYYHVGAQVIAQKEAGADGELFYYVHDRLGSVRAVVDIDMLTVNEYSYDSFGKMYQEECYEAIDSGTGQFIAENPFKYTGQYYDTEIGQYYLRARMYDPTMRCFTGRDPIRGSVRDTLSLHKYLYCKNNSVNMVDRSGKIPAMAIRAVVGGLLGGVSNYMSTEGGFKNKMAAFAVGALVGSISSLAGDIGRVYGIIAGISGSYANSNFMSWLNNDSPTQKYGRDLGTSIGLGIGFIGVLCDGFMGRGDSAGFILGLFGTVGGDTIGGYVSSVVESGDGLVEDHVNNLNKEMK